MGAKDEILLSIDNCSGYYQSYTPLAYRFVYNGSTSFTLNVPHSWSNDYYRVHLEDSYD